MASAGYTPVARATHAGSRYDATGVRSGTSETDLVGLVVNASWVWPTPDRLKELGVQWLRTIVYDDSFDDLDRALASVPSGIKIIAVLNSETKARRGCPVGLGRYGGPLRETLRRPS